MSVVISWHCFGSLQEFECFLFLVVGLVAGGGRRTLGFQCKRALLGEAPRLLGQAPVLLLALGLQSLSPPLGRVAQLGQGFSRLVPRAG